MSARHEPVLDQEKLDQNTMSNAELQRELFLLFFDQTPLYVDQMEEARARGDAEGWRQAAHGVKGSARALGLIRVAVVATEAEAGKPEAATVDALREALEATRTHVEGIEAPQAA